MEIPERVVGECAGEHRLVSALCPLTRIPTGEQLGVPSLLDYGLASPGIILDSAVDWEIAMADHGAYCCEARISVQHLPQPKPTTWKCVDWTAAVSWARHHVMESLNSVEDLTKQVVRLQSAFQKKTSAAQERRNREPGHIKELRARLRICNSAVERERLQRSKFSAKKAWLASLKTIRCQALLAKGAPLLKRKKLLPISSMSTPAVQKSLDHDIWAECVQAEYSNRWGERSMHALSIIDEELIRGNGLGPQPLQRTCASPKEL